MEINENYGSADREDSGLKWGLGLAVVALLVVAGVSFAYVSRERGQLNELKATNQSLSTSIAQLKTEMQAMADRLDRPPAPAERMVAQSTPRASSPSRPASRVAADSRYTQMQKRLANQERELSSTREDLNKTRDDLEGKLNSTRDELSGTLLSTRDELNGSIGRTHDDVVALQRRGERNYYEFQLAKSKEFRRVGPLSLSLRKVNTKRKSYDLAMFVDDNQMQKKSVNLYEPVWINLEDRPQPVQLVVNQIGKDQIQGYISEPKYKKSELGDAASAAPATAPGFKQQ
jgi:outer membrane murein-binding lipoprotein Lpp